MSNWSLIILLLDQLFKKLPPFLICIVEVITYNSGILKNGNFSVDTLIRISANSLGAVYRPHGQRGGGKANKSVVCSMFWDLA